MSLIKNGYLMSGDSIVGTVNDDIVTVTDKARSPLFFNTVSDISIWLKDRAIDTTRAHSRALRRVCSILNRTEAEIALYFHGKVVTDNYWVKASDEDITYKDVDFISDELFELALLGDLSYLSPAEDPIRSPQMMVNGSLEKGWKFDSNGWSLYKAENNTEKFNELFCMEVSRMLNIPTATYEVTESGVKSPNFCEQYDEPVNFEDMEGLVGDNWTDYSYCFSTLNDTLGLQCAEQYLSLIYFDGVVRNVDRHSHNLGILRNAESGELIGIAPNYDYNQSLFGNNSITNPRLSKSDLLTDDFLDLIEDLINKGIVKQYPYPDDVLSIDKIKAQTGYIKDLKLVSDEVYDKAVELVSERQRYLHSKIDIYLSKQKEPEDLSRESDDEPYIGL